MKHDLRNRAMREPGKLHHAWIVVAVVGAE
jgi:hypothetical protein